LRQLDEKAKLGDADDQRVKVLPHALLHEFELLPFHELALGFGGRALGLAGAFSDLMEFGFRDWAGCGWGRGAATSGRAFFSSLGPGRVFLGRSESMPRGFMAMINSLADRVIGLLGDRVIGTLVSHPLRPL